MEPSGKTKIDEMDKGIGGALPNKNIVRFDIAVNGVSRMDKFQKEKLVLESRKCIYNNVDDHSLMRWLCSINYYSQ